MTDEQTWLEEFDRLLLRDYCITVADAGWEGHELYARFGDDWPQDAVTLFAEKYGLVRRRDENNM